MHFKFIKSQDAYPLRSEVLYNGRPLSHCQYDGDETKGSFHVGAYENGMLIAIATFIPNNSAHFIETQQYQLRGMASAVNARGKGAGKQLLAFAMEHLKQMDIKLLWCNAREKAIPFYEKCGFISIGPPFMIKEIGWHDIMFIRLR